MLAVGLVMTILAYDDSLFLLEDGSSVNLTLAHAAALTSAPIAFSSEGRTGGLQTMPLVFALIPLAGMAFFTAAQRSRLRQVPAPQRLAFAAAGALPLALIVVIAAVAGKLESDDTEGNVAAGSAFLLTLLLGGIGGLLGARMTMRGEQRPSTAREPGRASELQANPLVAVAMRALPAALRPLLIGLALTAAVGTLIVVVQTARDAGNIKSDRTAVPAIVENALYAPEHGLHVFELGSFVQFEALAVGLALPVPVDRVESLLEDNDSESSAFGPLLARTELRLFDYGNAVPSWLFILGLLAFIAVPVVLALYAGFAAARAAGATTAVMGAAWGASTGPVWALTMVILNGLANKTATFPLWGLAEAGSVFGFSLLIGAVFGALGGLLSMQGTTARSAASPGPAPRAQI